MFKKNAPRFKLSPLEIVGITISCDHLNRYVVNTIFQREFGTEIRILKKAEQGSSFFKTYLSKLFECLKYNRRTLWNILYLMN